MALEAKTLEKPDQQQKPDATQSQKPDQSQAKPDSQQKPEEKKPRGSIYEDVGLDEPGKEGSSTWSATWREDLATDDAGKVDEKQLALLKRYASPKAWHQSSMAARQRIASGEYKRTSEPPPEGAKPEEVAAWREENGLPKEATEFQIAADGIKLEELSEADRGHIGTIQKMFFETKLTKAQGDGLAKQFLQLTEQVKEQEATADANNMDAVEDELRAEWGPEYRNNQKMNAAFMKQELGDDWENTIKARMPNGMRIAENPLWAKFINKMARAEGGDSFVRNDDNTGGKGIDAEIAEIEAVMGRDMGEYHRKYEKRYGELLAMKEKKGQLPD